MGLKAQRPLCYGYLALQSRDALAHSVSSALQEGPHAEQQHLIPHWAPLCFPEHASSLLPGLFKHTHPPFAGLTVQVQLLFCICSYLSSSVPHLLC